MEIVPYVMRSLASVLADPTLEEGNAIVALKMPSILRMLAVKVSPLFVSFSWSVKLIAARIISTMCRLCSVL